MALEEETMGFWERLMNFKDKHGYWNLTKLVLFVAFAVALLFLAKNFGETYSFERQRDAMVEALKENEYKMTLQHNEQMEMRRSIKPYVMEILNKTLLEMGCERAFVIELHNGSNNTAGLPFIHATMTYEAVARDAEPVDDDYQNITVTRFVFSEYLHNHDLWYGSIDEFVNFDPKMGGRLKHNGAKYLVMTTLRSDNNEIGYFGFIYYTEQKHYFGSKSQMEFILQSVQKLSKMLNKDSSTE